MSPTKRRGQRDSIINPGRIDRSGTGGTVVVFLKDGVKGRKIGYVDEEVRSGQGITVITR